MGIAKYEKDKIQIKRATITQGTSGANTTVWNTVYTGYAFINSSAGGKQFTIGKNVVISTGTMFITNTTNVIAANITEKDKIYCVDSSETYEILYIKRPKESLKNKIRFYSMDIRNVK
jgi:hypothetical protein